MGSSLKTLSSLQGRVALVTGAAGHLGQTIVEVLAELGASVFMLDKDKDKLSLFAQQFSEKYPQKIWPILFDLELKDAPEQILKLVIEKVGALDILINNAAFVGTSELSGWSVDFEQQETASWERVFYLNVTLPFALVQQFSKLLQQSSHASVINIGSIYGVVAPDMSLYVDLPMGNPAAYAASKAGIIHLTRWLASALAPQVRVNTITPGGIWRNQADKFCERYNAKVLLGRMASEADLRGAIMYLASDLSSYVTGHNLVVDGGWTVI